ncbi:OpgC domain-containing protein [Hymenobacter tenuis]
MERNQQLDFFRGAFLILITVNHFLSENNIIRYFTYEFIGWVTGAEGFVFISGLTLGLVYTRSYDHKNAGFISTLAFKRSWLIYKNHLGILLLTVLLLNAIGPLRDYWNSTYPLITEKPFLSLLLGVILLSEPIYLDILPMYAIFMLFVPVIIRGFTNGKIWLIILVSAVIYLLGTLTSLPLLPPPHFLPDYIDVGFFDLLCWQLIFVLGILVGFLHYHGKTQGLLNSRVLVWTSVILCLTCFVFRHLETTFPQFNFGILISKNHLGLFRILNFLALFNIVAFVANKKVNWFKNEMVEGLGRNSLNVFLLNILILILLKPIQSYFDSLYYFKVNHFFYFYPVSLLLLVTLVIPTSYLVPFFSDRRRIKHSQRVSA